MERDRLGPGIITNLMEALSYLKFSSSSDEDTLRRQWRALADRCAIVMVSALAPSGEDENLRYESASIRLAMMPGPRRSRSIALRASSARDREKKQGA